MLYALKLITKYTNINNIKYNHDFNKGRNNNSCKKTTRATTG